MRPLPQHLASDFLIQHDLSVLDFALRGFAGFRLHPFTEVRFRGLLRDPFMRSIIEIDLNGTTDYRSSMCLVGRGFAQFRWDQVRLSDDSVLNVEVIELMPDGRSYLKQACRGVSDVRHTRPRVNPWDLLSHAVGGYLVVDQGSGFVATTATLQSAVDLHDFEFLYSVVGENGEKQTPAIKGIRDPATEAAWLDIQDCWSADHAPRTGAKIIRNYHQF